MEILQCISFQEHVEPERVKNRRGYKSFDIHANIDIYIHTYIHTYIHR